jgi:imidazolonepropionase
MQFAIALTCRYIGLTPRRRSLRRPSTPRHPPRRPVARSSLITNEHADLSVPDYRHLGYRFGTNLVKQVIKRGGVYSVDVGYYRTA